MKKATNFKPETIVAKLFAAMQARKQFLLDNGHIVSDEITKKNGLLDNFNPDGNSYRECLKAVENVKAVFDFGHLIAIAEKGKPNGSNDAQYIQVKAFEKLIRFVKAFGFKDFRMLDNHTRAIMFNAMLNNGVISSAGAFASLVRVEFDELSSATSEVLRLRHKYTPGTGSTQLSSTRELFRILGLCDSTKGAKDAPIVFTEAARSALIQHFEQVANAVGAPDAVEETEEETEAE